MNVDFLKYDIISVHKSDGVIFECSLLLWRQCKMWRGVVAEHSDLTWPVAVGASATGSLAR